MVGIVDEEGNKKEAKGRGAAGSRAGQEPWSKTSMKLKWHRGMKIVFKILASRWGLRLDDKKTADSPLTVRIQRCSQKKVSWRR